jgi:predicted nuclease of predicted toxin-antitoxin system
VKDVLDLLAAGATREEILTDYPYLEAEDLAAVLEFAAKQNDHPVLRSAWLRFLVDAQLPPALARHIESRGHHAEHVADLGLDKATDVRIRAKAAESGAVIVTKDEDFAVHHILHQGPSVVWIRIGNTRRAELLRRFDAELPKIIAALERGDTLIELA